MHCYEIPSEYFESVGNAGHAAYYSNKEQAFRVARTAANETNAEATVNSVVVRDGKAGLLAALNGQNWCTKRELVYTAKPKGGDLRVG